MRVNVIYWSVLALMVAGFSVSFSYAQEVQATAGAHQLDSRAFPTKIDPEMLEYLKVTQVSISQVSVVNMPDDFTYTGERLCEQAKEIIEDTLKHVDIKVYGCNEAVPSGKEASTLYLNAQIISSGTGFYGGKLAEERAPIVQINTYTYRLHPKRSFIPDIHNYQSYPTYKREAWQMFNSSFEDIFTQRIQSLVQPLTTGK